MAEQRLINANAILYIEAVDGDTFEGTGKLYARKEDIDALPIIEERKTGKWILQEDKNEKLYGWHICSECSAWIGEPTNFCSNCGADMREQP